MSQITGSAPIASRSEAWSGLRIRPRARWPPSASSRSSLSPTCPCPPATTTSMAQILGPLWPAARPGDAERLEQVQPDLAAGGERRHGVEEPGERHLAHDGDRGRLEEVGYLEAGDRGADDHVAVLVHHEPGRAGRAVAAVEAGAGVALGRYLDRTDVHPVLLRRVERVPHRRHLRVGEDHARGELAGGGCV